MTTILRYKAVRLDRTSHYDQTSFDGKTWRVHTGRKAKVVYEWTPC